jgi:aromatic ring-opening dioxygenase LigB subunit
LDFPVVNDGLTFFVTTGTNRNNEERDFALDPTFFPDGTIERRVSDDIAANARKAGRWLVEGTGGYGGPRSKPDVVLLTTPHGIKLDRDYGIYMSSLGSGTSTIGTDLGKNSSSGSCSGGRWVKKKPYNVSLNVALAPISMGEELLTMLEDDSRFPVSGIYSYNDEAPMPLNWGEIIPLLLLPGVRNMGSNSSGFHYHCASCPKPLIWTFPYRRYDHAPDMVPELLQMGAIIMEWAEARPEKIGMIVSGDLSHTHLASGPYGYSNASGPYDEAIGRWAGHDDPCDEQSEEALLGRARTLQPDAKSCGFTGYVLWHGMMCHHPTEHDNNHGRRRFHSRVFVNRNVTYYGMIAASFEPIRNNSVSDSRRRKRLS